MKRSVQLPAAITCVFFCAIAFTSCFDPIPEGYEDYFGYTPNVAKPSGGTLSLLDGNVEMIVPEGAVSVNTVFIAKECENQAQCKFLLKMVRIEPNIVFNKPVTMRLKYNGSLSNNDFQIDNCKPVICYWKNQEDYLNGIKQTCISCCIDSIGLTIDFCSQQTGIFAVGNNGNGEFD